MSKALLQQHAAKALREHTEQQKQQADQQASNAQVQALNAQNQVRNIQAQHAQAIAQANTENRSLKVEVAQLRVDLQNHEHVHEAREALPAYEDLPVACAGCVE